MLKSYKEFGKLYESAPRIPNKLEYWLRKGKSGKNVAIFFHDDCDGVYVAITVKNYLENKGFKIVQYGIVNYQESWANIELNPDLINIALDFAMEIPESAKTKLDVYIDHHGQFTNSENKSDNAVKTDTGSAYEGVCDQLGIPVDSTVLSIIDMIDSAKYDDYNVDIKNILDFKAKDFKNKLEFAAAFNQLLKRSDYKTFIEVVGNTKDISPSIYNIFKLFRILYPANNLDNIALKKLAKAMGYIDPEGKPDVNLLIDHLKDTNPKQLSTFEKDFLTDAYWRLDQMKTKTRGASISKEYIKDEDDFIEKFQIVNPKTGNNKIQVTGYQILGNMCFVPSGTWANALRARAILEKDLLNNEYIPIIEYRVLFDSPLYDDLLLKNGQTVELVGDISNFKGYTTFSPQEDVTDIPNIEGIKGVIEVKDNHIIFRAKRPIFWIMLQYGNTLQVCSLHKFDKYVKKYLPKVNGEPVTNLGKYCEDLLQLDLVKKMKYKLDMVPEKVTVSGGHEGIGTISNIFGQCRFAGSDYLNTRFLDYAKNKMIQDLSGIPWDDLTLEWGDLDERSTTPTEYELNKKIIKSSDIRNAGEVQKQYKRWKTSEK